MMVVLSLVVCLILGEVQVLAGDTIIDMSFRQAEIEDVFRTIATAGGLNLLTGRDVSGKITLDLQNVSVMTAIDTVARLSGYAYVLVDDILIVATPITIEGQFTEKHYSVYEPKSISVQDAFQIAAMVLAPENVNIVGSRLVIFGAELQFQVLKDILSEVDEPREQVLMFDDATLLDVLRAISLREGYALVMEPGVGNGKVTMDIDGVDSVSALDLLAEWYGLDYELEDAILKVKRKKDAAVQDGSEVIETESPAEKHVVSVVSSHYVGAADVKGMIEKLYAGQVSVEAIGEKMVAIKGFEEDVIEIVELIRQVDKPNAQVMVEVRVQEVSSNALEDLGLSWSLPTISGGVGEGQAKALNVDYSTFEIALNALVKAGRSKLLARPSISAVEGEKARVFIGDRIPIVLKSQSEKGTSESIDYFESGVLLEITPEIVSDGLITLVVESQISTITGWTPDNHPKTRTRETQTKVRVGDGQPVVIGGLLKQEDVSEDADIPFLRRLPIVGNLFKSNKTTGETVETLIFLIPRLVSTSTEFQGASQEEAQRAQDLFEKELAKAKDVTPYPLGLSIDVTSTDSLDIEAEVLTDRVTGLLFRGYVPNVLEQNSGISGLGFGIGLRKYANESNESLWVDILGDLLNLNVSPAGTAQYCFAAPRIGYRTSSRNLAISVYARYGFLWKNKGDVDISSVPGRATGLVIGCEIGVLF